MPIKGNLNPVFLSKLLLWAAMAAWTTYLLCRRRVSLKARLLLLAAGVLVFGVAYAFLTRGGPNPNPVLSLRGVLSALLISHKVILPLFASLAFLLLLVFISNKSICGWGCQLGLLQDLLFRVSTPKWQPPFWLTNGIRIAAFLALALGLAVAGYDWIAGVDPFRLFTIRILPGGVALGGVVLIASLFIYRPWCRFLCPFGLLSWVVEQASLFRPRIDRGECRGCQLCVRACPSGAMADFYTGKRIHADCFACGACIAACPNPKALGWWKPTRRRASSGWRTTFMHSVHSPPPQSKEAKISRDE